MTAEVCAQRIYGGAWENLTSSSRKMVTKTIAWCIAHAADLINDTTTYVSPEVYLAALKEALPYVSGLTWEQIITPCRRADVLRWREIATTLLRYHTTLRVTEIARLIHRHHASVIHEVNTCNDRCKYDRAFNADLYKLMAEINIELNN